MFSNNKEIEANPLSFFAKRFILLSLVVGFITRIALLFNPRTVIDFSFMDWFRIFFLGGLCDVCFALLAILPFVIICLGFSDRKYSRPWNIIIESLLSAGFIYVFFFQSIFNEYGGGAPKIARAFFAYKLISFSLRLFLPRIRDTWRKVEIYLIFAIYVFCVYLNFIGEYCFWNEFGVRYNFIAVDYLVYTNEVIGNIFESYPIIPMLIVLVVLSALTVWLSVRKTRISIHKVWTMRRIVAVLVALAVLPAFSYNILTLNRNHLSSSNLFASELQSNGSFDFCEAFRSNKLDYRQFYPLLNESQCRQLMSGLCAPCTSDTTSTDSVQKPLKKNIVLITVESLSASYLKDYGNSDGLTPNLDTLMRHSMVFDNLFAAGNRTVRGLEALSLCSPPSAGESIIKRPGNTGLNTVGSYLRKNGYTVQFIYGGDSYFDNMGEYFGGNGYKVIDRNSFNNNEVTFTNIWGTCDEDSYRKSIAVIDSDAVGGKPFFVHIMTISNHRPFTYPAGKITVKGKAKSREGGVKYTDYAIGQFLKAARGKSWFRNTVFIIVADHCASSAGATDIPIENYHIPAIVYSPSFIRPQRVGTLCSQIDLMPTVLSMLNMQKGTHFVGRNILSGCYVPRAFMATYQCLGYYESNLLTVLSPVRQIRQYSVKRQKDFTYSETPVTRKNKNNILKTEAYYQSANIGLK
jgi:phosphoglycerol transferase MdoB-like AlkP superfamily enzyme